ncbi:MAG: aerobic carbon-monoxide dehydrogenase medium subunit [Mycobacterium sp.]|jgi:carbon-monoxide dehydrogenase medium subunit|nr:aerobic carbon-monoxide dehydrogenase medium subunit [Mycobacterium sp.]
MIPSAFAYVAPETLDDALSILAASDDDTKVMAGGQSLIPLLKLRLASPAVVMDICRLDSLRDVEETTSAFMIGALVTHERLINNHTIGEKWSIIEDAGEDLADPLVRNRGTFGGSLAHADPAGDWPAVALVTDVVVHVQSLRGTRKVPVKDFFTYLFTADVADDEILTHVELPKPVPGTVTAYVKIAHPASGYAVAAAGVSLTIDASGTCRSARVALTGVATTPLRSAGAEGVLEGGIIDADAVQRAIDHAADGIAVMGDTYAPAEYRRHLIGVVTGRAIQRALDRRV